MTITKAFIKNLPLLPDTIEELHNIGCYNTVELLELNCVKLDSLNISNTAILDIMYVKYSKLY